jgi:hypothetical protein
MASTKVFGNLGAHRNRAALKQALCLSAIFTTWLEASPYVKRTNIATKARMQ